MLQDLHGVQEIQSFLEAQQCLAGTRGANVLLQCGYFDAADAMGEEADDFALLTCRLGLALARQLKQRWPGTRVQFCTLVNDLGQTCSDASACTVPPERTSGTAMQARIANLLQAAQVPIAHHAFLFERNLRNRGLRMIKGGLSRRHPRLNRVADGESAQIFLLANGLQKILVATEQGRTLTGKCPVIMGAFYRDAVALLRNRFHQDTRQSLVIDLCHLVDRDKVLRGIAVARALGDGAPPTGPIPPRASLVPVFMDSAGGAFFPHCTPYLE
jgi:hypothetical protein